MAGRRTKLHYSLTILRRYCRLHEVFLGCVIITNISSRRDSFNIVPVAADEVAEKFIVAVAADDTELVVVEIIEV